MLQFGYLNNLYIGTICDNLSSGIIIQSGILGGSGQFSSSGNFWNTYNNNCVLYSIGIESSGSFTGQFNQAINGSGKTFYEGIIQNNLTGIETGHFTGILNGSFSGINLIYGSGLLEIFYPVSFISGQFSGQAYGFGFLGQQTSGFSGITNIGNTQAAILGIFSGIISGSGNLYFSGINYYNNFSGIQNYTFNGKRKDYFNYNGNNNFNGYYRDYFFTGSKLGLVSGSGIELFNGFSTGYCGNYQTPIYTNGTCNAFAPFMSDCSHSGTLNVGIFSSYTGNPGSNAQVRGLIQSCISFIPSSLAPNGSGYFLQTGIILGGDVYYPSGDNGGGAGNSGVSGIYVPPPINCPTIIANSPTCISGNDGSLIFVLYNDDNNICQIVSPYSGSLLYQVNPTDIPIQLSEGFDLPNKFEFDSLSQGYYTFLLSGSSGVLNLSTYLGNIVNLPYDLAVIKQPSSCISNDSLVRVQFNQGSYNYNIDNTYFGNSPTGFIVSGLLPGNHLFTLTSGNICTISDTFYIPPINPPFITFNFTGRSCTGSGNNGSIQLIGNGGSGKYTYKTLNSGFNNFTGTFLTGLNTGIYNFAITDSLGCSSTQSLYLNYDNKNLGLNIGILGNQTVCCQDTNPGDWGILYVQASRGIPPYNLVWNTTPTITGTFLSGYSYLEGVPPGSYSATVTDSVGCSVTSFPVNILSTNNCFDVKWSCVAITNNQENSGLFYVEQHYVTQLSGLPTAVQFDFKVPGNYLAKLSISDSYGRSGISCQPIQINPCFIQYTPGGGNGPSPVNPIPISFPISGSGVTPTPLPNRPPSNPPPILEPAPISPFPIYGSGQGPNPTPAPSGSAGGGGGGGGGGGDGNPDPGPPNGHNQVCCTLISIFGQNGQCQTDCSPQLAGCNGNALGPQQAIGGSCFPNNPCNNIWSPQAGSLCCQTLVPGPEPFITYNCAPYQSVCDPNALIAQQISQNKYISCTWTAGGKCPDDNCQDLQFCGVDNGCGIVCQGLYSKHDCDAMGGDQFPVLVPGDTCADVGTLYPDLGNNYYFELDTINCCGSNIGGMPTCCVESDCETCIQHGGSISFIPMDADALDPQYICPAPCNCPSSS